MYLLIIYLPLISFLINIFLGRYVGRKGASIISIILLNISFIISLILWYEIISSGSTVTINLIKWIECDYLNINWEFIYDQLSIFMLIVILSISTIIHLYSISYMYNDPHLQRFLSYLSLFTFFMIIMVTGSNLTQIFLGWELIGITSYLLICFWYSKLEANRAAIQAILMNRIGDWGFLIGIFFSIFIFNTTDISIIWSSSYLSNIIEYITFFLLIGVIAKSSQLGLHTWLPSAMLAPTPVSALLHSATMV